MNDQILVGEFSPRENKKNDNFEKLSKFPNRVSNPTFAISVFRIHGLTLNILIWINV